MPGVLLALIAKLAGLGTAAKAGVATATAALTMTVAGGAAGVLPLPGGGTDTQVVQSALQVASAVLPTTTSTPPTTAARTAAPVAPATTSPARATRNIADGASTSVSVPPVTTVITSAGVPTASAVADRTIPALPACVANLVPAAGTRPDPATLITRLPACIRSVITAHLPLDVLQRVIGSANLPVDISKCLSAVLTVVTTVAGGNVSGLPQLLSACLPSGGSLGAGSIPGLGSLPGFRPGR